MLALAALIVAAFALYLAISFHTAVARTDGTIRTAGLREPVTIARDERDIPHINARNEHDLFFAQGFVEGSDRLFQIDLTRHAVYGRLAEWFGWRALSADERARIVDVRGIVARQFSRLTAAQRAELQAFSDGVNAAIQLQPLPFEYRLLLLRPAKWQPQDSLAVGFATVLVLSDSYRDVLSRDMEYVSHEGHQSPPAWMYYAAMHPLSDLKYDAPTADLSGRPGSNAWAAGALHSLTGRALLANDPHLAPSIPGIWYLIDLHAPTYHAAGASLAGTPGVILGHNDAIAWGATNGSVAAQSVFCRLRVPTTDAIRENFRVRFGHATSQIYFREKRGFFVTNRRWNEQCLVAWSAYSNATSPLTAFDGLDRAASLEDARRALAQYPGPTQNFVLAQSDGRAAYQLAGWIPNDPAWARYAHRDGYHAFPILPFHILPHVTAARGAVVWTANNKMYGRNYPYRLTATFEPPFRAHRIKTLLQKRSKYDISYFSQMQADVYSEAELDFIKSLVRIARRNPQFVPSGYKKLLSSVEMWDGYYSENSAGATVAHDVRINETVNPLTGVDTFQVMLAGLHGGRETLWYSHVVLSRMFTCFNNPSGPCVRQIPWRDAGAVTIHHPLHGLGVSWLDGPTLAGDGDKFTLHVQREAFTQSFRAVWDVGNWDAGGIVIPCGESGEPGSPHYQDLSRDWIDNKLIALPYSERAVERHAVTSQTLTP
ncbi:MAG: penicillin acylase family protein [Candidatus Eremiobacteraeota bacterium]|nr:penicillin acylase family protein [Candidatus Eremiobacteraeota bacterium]